jgi:outer membrane protein OmpA-like peptidoglycan-associated protein
VNRPARFLRLAAVTLGPVALVGLVGCATVAPPRELVEARTTYTRVANGPTAQLKPDALLTAKQQLDRAEKSFADDGASRPTKDAAYIATRRALLAEADANTVAAMKAKTDAQAAAIAKQGADLSQAQGALAQTKGQLVKSQEALDAEKRAREEAEKRAEAAMADLRKFAEVKKDDRGMVITLAGGVLFKTDKSELLPAAQARLNQIADALTRTSPDAKLVVGGYTDSQGTEAHNQELSEQRAKSVADYLVTRGVARDRVTSKGFGQGNPIADNKSVEGRAQNRRVEIVVNNP